MAGSFEWCPLEPLCSCSWKWLLCKCVEGEGYRWELVTGGRLVLAELESEEANLLDKEET